MAVIGRRSGFAAAMLGVVLAACGSGSGGPGKVITATDNMYDVTTFDVAGGASVTVTLQNNGKTAHSFTAMVNGQTVEADTEPGTSKSVSFTAPSTGTVSYHCKYHPDDMKGQITIGGAGTNSSSSSSSSGGGGYG
jgi:plastocyanin